MLLDDFIHAGGLHGEAIMVMLGFTANISFIMGTTSSISMANVKFERDVSGVSL